MAIEDDNILMAEDLHSLVKKISLSNNTITITPVKGTNYTLQIPNDKVLQYQSAHNGNLPILGRASTSTDNIADTTKYSSGITLNPATNTITATTFKGALNGNASTATKATQDASGNIITSTYAKKTDLSSYTPIITSGTYFSESVITLKTNATSGSYTLTKDFFGTINIGASNSSGNSGSGGTYNISIGTIVNVSVTCGWRGTGEGRETYSENKTFSIYIPKGTKITCTADTSDKPYASSCYISLSGLLRK
jgi:hypothetical protein